MHRRVTLFARGTLLRQQDPDALDLTVGQLAHDNPGVEFVRLGPSTTYASGTQLVGLDKILSRERGLEVDLLGEPPAAIEFVEPLTVAIDPLQCDLTTRFELGRITQAVSTSRNREVYRLDADAIRARWPKETLEHVVSLFDRRTVDGLPAAEYLRLRAALDMATRATIRRDVTVLTIDSAADADRLAQAPEIASYIVARLGDRTFAIDSDRESELLDVLHDIGIRGGGSE